MWSDVKPYFRTKMVALGYSKEHYDGFNPDNIASTVMHNSYMVDISSINGSQDNQDFQQTEVGVKLSIFRNGYRKPKEAIDAAIADAQTIVSSMIQATNRLASPTIHNIFFDALSLKPIDASNDNSFIMEIEFRASVLFSTR
jgi:hypothetical protein